MGLDHPKVKLFIADGNDFVNDKTEMYDIIISDSSDSNGWSF